jgi:hypothetical protein
VIAAFLTRPDWPSAEAADAMPGMQAPATPASVIRASGTQ